MLGTRLDGRDNALNFLRLVLASAVIFAHSWPLGGLGGSRLEGISGLAVDGFFALSGYLIAGSRMRLPMRDFLVRRMLRILPGFWVCLVLTAFVFAPLSAFKSGSYELGSALEYLRHDALLTIRQYDIQATLQHVPYTEVWDGSLWTLEFEFAAYLAAGVLLTGTWVRRHARLVLIGLAVFAIVVQPLAHGPLHVTTNVYLNALRLGAFFLAGMAVWTVRDRVPVRRDLVTVTALASAAVLALVGDWWFHVLLAVPLTYLLFALGALLPVRIGAVNDVSYGMYIYAFPLQQLVVLFAGGVVMDGLAPALGVTLLTVVTLVLTVPVAWASWLLVERPCLRLAGRLTSRRTPAAEPVPV